MKNPRWFLVVLCLAGAAANAIDRASTDRLDEVAERGRHVMPFSLEKTTHVFTKLEDGGRQQVTVKNPNDGEQIRLIRHHLSQIASDFAKGDFAGPSKIHGDDMPGLNAMRTAPTGAIAYRFKALPEGGQIDYVSADTGLIAAIHRYFDTQLRDHARHAVAGHGQHSAHAK
jgi:hypothetical protein